MKSVIYFILIAWCRYSFVITWKEIIKRFFCLPIILASIALKFMAILAAIVVFGLLLAVYGALTLVIGPFMWLFEKIFPNSLFFYQKRMPDDFRHELLGLNLEI